MVKQMAWQYRNDKSKEDFFFSSIVYIFVWTLLRVCEIWIHIIDNIQPFESDQFCETSNEIVIHNHHCRNSIVTGVN